ncbi:hypothetical protein BKA62DRAFT_722000 [Auriculariales sp. MPI-PUGE-AT-0066]|nr:hypothetical protein BKA62DRAFT_722000 [Auriculariales sp. MPI-PUGE-AT-0066]
MVWQKIWITGVAARVTDGSGCESGRPEARIPGAEGWLTAVHMSSFVSGLTRGARPIRRGQLAWGSSAGDSRPCVTRVSHSAFGIVSYPRAGPGLWLRCEGGQPRQLRMRDMQRKLGTVRAGGHMSRYCGLETLGRCNVALLGLLDTSFGSARYYRTWQMTEGTGRCLMIGCESNPGAASHSNL